MSNENNINFGIVYFLINSTGFLYFDGKLTRILATGDIPSGNNLFWCNLTAYELSEKGLKDSRFIDDGFFEIKMRAMLKEVGLDIVNLTDGFEKGDNLSEIEVALSFANNILYGTVAFSNKYLLDEEVSEMISLKDIFSYQSFSKAIYACITRDYKSESIKQSISDIFAGSSDLLQEAINSISRDWVIVESANDMPGKQEAILSTTLLTEHRQSLFAKLLCSNIPKGTWREPSVEEVGEDVKAYLDSLKSPVLCKVNFEKADVELSRFLAFGGLQRRQGGNGLMLGSVMNNWMTIDELRSVIEYIKDYTISNILICDSEGPHPLLSLYKKIIEDFSQKGSGWKVSYFSGFIEIHLFEAVNKKIYVNSTLKNIKTPAGAYLGSAQRLKSLSTAFSASETGRGQMKTVDCFWPWSYGKGKIGIRLAIPEDLSTTNLDDRIAIAAQKTSLIPPVLNCMSISDDINEESLPDEVVRFLHITGALESIRQIDTKVINQLNTI